VAPGLSAGDTTAMAQATHGSAPDIAGAGRANPYAMIMSVQMLTAWLGNHHGDGRLTHAAAAIRAAVDAVLTEPAHRTPDLAGTATTQEMGEAVVRAL